MTILYTMYIVLFGGRLIMKKDRANEIEQKVMYAYLNYMPFDTIDTVSAFHVGRMIGRIQATLHAELFKEVEDENKN